MPHIHDTIDFTAEVFIVYNNKVLLRKHDKYNLWLSIGGHIELNEDPNQTAIREAKEEVGMDIILENSLQAPDQKEKNYQELIPPYFMNRHRINDNHEHVTFIYFATTKTDEIKQPLTEEMSKECRWFSKEDLKEDKEIKESVKYYALKALEILGE